MFVIVLAVLYVSFIVYCHVGPCPDSHGSYFPFVRSYNSKAISKLQDGDVVELYSLYYINGAGTAMCYDPRFYCFLLYIENEGLFSITEKDRVNSIRTNECGCRKYDLNNRRFRLRNRLENIDDDFCIVRSSEGNRLRIEKEVYKRILEKYYSIDNYTYNRLKDLIKEYSINDIDQCNRI